MQYPKRASIVLRSGEGLSGPSLCRQLTSHYTRQRRTDSSPKLDYRSPGLRPGTVIKLIQVLLVNTKLEVILRSTVA
jgi:hypothetical protein